VHPPSYIHIMTGYDMAVKKIHTPGDCHGREDARPPHVKARCRALRPEALLNSPRRRRPIAPNQKFVDDNQFGRTRFFDQFEKSPVPAEIRSSRGDMRAGSMSLPDAKCSMSAVRCSPLKL